MAWLFALAAGGYVVYVRTANNWTVGQPAPATADLSKPRQAVAALGRIEPRGEIINLGAGTPAPDRLESLLVARGDFVKKGQVLGYLAGFAEQVAQLEVFKRQLEEAKLRQETEVELNRSRIESAETHQEQILKVSPLRIAAQEEGRRHRA